jgi:Alginate export
LDIGSRRVLERVEMANVIFAYTGAYWGSVSDRGDEWHVVYVSPVGRLPTTFPELADNEIVADKEEWGRVFWGAHYRRPKALEGWISDAWVEGFLYRLKERDTADVATPNRDYVQPGFRVFRAPKEGRSDFEIETSWRTGSRRATNAVSDVRDLDVNAWTMHAHWAWSFKSKWKWRVGVDYDFASGDKSPADGRFDRFERLFGGRRTDLGNTGIYGPLTPANLAAPGARVEFTPSRRLDFRVSYKAAYLASATDLWTDARLQDPTGKSGRFIGHSWDSRMRYWLVPGTIRGEVGASALFPGRFAKTAPNAPKQSQSLFGYGALLVTF